ncbi:hypothetical protein PAF17_15960 [Paracoccus sp. Z330]|uniref:Uncharacterized protein n=1 Tax=Paracoccus onchidii TaxID=3017813 RepID=A0ABT4ZI00_9RHOB|nr:hypothetical protein [Paracoccus onchidii]MDB6178987.1 hypothetical protein [Paracoccus onchidii]
MIVDIELDGYFRPDMGEGRRSMILARWCDELEDWPVDAIRAAMAKWCRDFPRIRPNYGDILGLLRAAWGERNAHKVREALSKVEQHKGMSREDHERISAEMADKLASFVNRVPKVQE